MDGEHIDQLTTITAQAFLLIVYLPNAYIMKHDKDPRSDVCELMCQYIAGLL